MVSKNILKIAVFTLITAGLAQGGIMSSESPATIAKEQEVLSKQLILSYAKKHDISEEINNIKEKQDILKGKISDPEIKNLLQFLNICLRDIQKLNNKPHNRSNMQRIADLGASISEGSRYIANTLR